MRKSRFGLPLCLLGLALTSPALAAPPDEKLRARADAAKPELIETLRQMVMIESGSSDVEGLSKMADFTEGRLKALGAKTERRKTSRGTGADIVSTACPYCLIMLDDATKSRQAEGTVSESVNWTICWISRLPPSSAGCALPAITIWIGRSGSSSSPASRFGSLSISVSRL